MVGGSGLSLAGRFSSTAAALGMGAALVAAGGAGFLLAFLPVGLGCAFFAVIKILWGIRNSCLIYGSKTESNLHQILCDSWGVLDLDLRSPP